MLADQSTQLRLSVKKDILHFSRTLINVQGLDDWAWDLVAHIFRESSLHSSQMPNFLRPRGSSPMQLGVVASALGDSSTHILP
ncbi:hypothetical protein Y1Q_0006558 [Alligator mississippiensis]|uniref:Uncharacterized protein n=1 Tax=Alligator mississippiensis TaxID=8496 RepID=A0A151NTF1_ALLMI|nr:hypothetical protein Y1Q_0006558 [Alligator mississippiensis]